MNMMSAASLVGSFKIDEVENNGELSNGDIITVTISTNDEALKNAKVSVKNTELQFTVSGLEEKTVIDVFDDVTLAVSGSSPYCSVSAEYSGSVLLNEYSFQITSTDGKENGTFQNGDKVTVVLDEDKIDYLEKYSGVIVNETSREYTVQADSSYILSAEDLSGDSANAFQDTFMNYVNKRIEGGKDGTDKDAKWNLISGVSGFNAGTLAASTCSLNDVENISFNSAYAGVIGENFYGIIKYHKRAYLFYDADISYMVKRFGGVTEDTVSGVIVVCVENPIISSDGEITYSDISIASAADFQTAYDARISDSMSKIL